MIVTGVVPDIVPQPHTVTTNAPDGDSGAHPDAASDEKPKKKQQREDRAGDDAGGSGQGGSDGSTSMDTGGTTGGTSSTGSGGSTGDGGTGGGGTGAERHRLRLLLLLHPGTTAPGSRTRPPGTRRIRSTLPLAVPLSLRTVVARFGAAPRGNGSSMSTMNELTTSASVSIDAPVQEVWAAITTPATIKQWFFGVDTESDWEVGSSLVHRGEWQGKPYEDKGEIVRIDPPKLLVHTHWSDASGTPDRPESYQEVTWALEERDEGTQLTVSERNLPSEEAKQVSDQSWTMVLGNLKQLLER